MRCLHQTHTCTSCNSTLFAVGIGLHEVAPERLSGWFQLTAVSEFLPADGNYILFRNRLSSIVWMPHTFFSSFAITATRQSNLLLFSSPAAVLRIPVVLGCSSLDLQCNSEWLY